MGHNDSINNNGEFFLFLQEVINGGHLEGAALGITKLVIDKGSDVLSSKQRFVFERDVIRDLTTNACSRCEGDIPWSEMYAAFNNGKLCSYCSHMQEKIKYE